MKNKKTKKIILLVIIILCISSVSVFLCITNKNKKETKTSIINISECSEEFMENYYEGVDKIRQYDNEENILIVTSTKDITNSYGAIEIIKAPNNQYFLQYNTEEEKENALNEFNSSKEILYVEENIKYHVAESEYNSWGIEQTGMDKAIEVAESNNLNEVTVAIIDTGLNVNLFNQNYPNKLKSTYNAMTQTSNMYDNNGHGTHIAGTIAESTPNNVKILPIKVSDERLMDLIYIIHAINYITYNKNADVINMSFGSYEYSESMYTAIKGANENNIISVAAAGNDSTSDPLYPAHHDNTISISAVDKNLQLADFSNYGSSITFSAPGVDILSINGTNSGTSMATPHAVSAVAILKSFDKNYTLEETITELKKYTIDLGEDGWDREFGYGLINFNGAPLCEKNAGCLFKNNSEETIIKKIEVEDFTTIVNYGTITNILNAKIKLYYDNGISIEKQLWQLEDLEILNYDPFSYTNQKVTLKYKGHEITINVDNQNATELYFNYEVIDEEAKTAKITDFLWTDQDFPNKLYVPETLDGYTITTIGKETFKQDGPRKYIILPETVTNFEDSAFYYCYARIEVTAPEITVASYAFYGANFVDNTINSKILSLGYSSFEYSNIKDINLSDLINAIPDRAFNNCKHLTEIDLPDNIIMVGDRAFYGCESLKNVEIPSKVHQIYDYAFAYCSSLESVSLPEELITISKGAFADCISLTSINIPKKVYTIGTNAFQNTHNLETITVDPENPNFDSRDNSNSIIRTSTNKLYFSSNNTVIPASVTTIAEYAFYGRLMEEINIPEGVTTIENNAFAQCSNLERVLMPKTVTSIGSDSFRNTNESITLWVYDNTYPKTYAEEKSINYLLRDQEIYDLDVDLPKKQYKAFEEVDTTGMKITIIYYNGTITRKDYEGSYTIKYIDNRTSLRFTDQYIIVSIVDGNREIEKKVPVTVERAVPKFTVPTDLTAKVGQKLSEITLPSNFEWMDETQAITEVGQVTYKAKYIPNDTINYYIVINIDIVISVTKEKEILIPEIEIKDKVYDKTTTIDPSNITISNIDSTYYSIESASLATADAGETTATIKLKLTDEAYENYMFENKTQEQEYIVETTIFPLSIEKPTAKDKTYTYNEAEQEFSLNNFDNEKMNIAGNIRKDAGKYDVTISLKSSNYIWKDNSTTDIVLVFEIKKATPKYTIPTNLTAKVGQKLSEITLPAGFVWETPTQEITKAGEGAYKAKYIPTDTNNYKTIENIDIKVTASKEKTIIVPEIKIADKVYDGTKNLSLENISISNLKAEDYTIENIIVLSENVGTTQATIKIKLTDEFYADNMFSDNSQEKEFSVEVTIVPAKVQKPTSITKTYIYIGEEQTYLLSGFNSEIMNITGNTRTNAGEQKVVVSLKNNNYTWTDGTTDNIEFTFTIKKATPNIEYSASNNNVIYDGKAHSIVLAITSPTNAKIKYMDEEGNYSLEEMPKYTNVGEYVIKYKIFIDDNYTEIYGENTLIINLGTIENNTKDYECIYDGSPHSINIDVSLDEYEIKYSVNDLSYNLDELPTFTEVGEYTINYKITSPKHDSIVGSNKVKIYGIKEIDSSLEQRNNLLIIKDRDNIFENVTNKIRLFALTSKYNHYDKNNELTNEDIIKTGDKLEIIINNKKLYEYYISISGDINGDGKISALDYVKVKNHIMETNKITEEIYLIAADANNDNKISALDYVRIKNIIMEEVN